MPKGYSKATGLPHRPPPPKVGVPFHKPLRPVYMPVGPSIAYVELTKGQWALIDADDAELIGRWNWHASWNTSVKEFRAVRAELLPTGRQRWFTMHSFLLGLHGRKLNADHIRPGNGLDNRRCNLRPAEQVNQAANKRRYASNTSGFKGVSPARHKEGMWLARIQVAGRRIVLGEFPSPEAAHDAYKAAALELHGKFARMD